MTPRAPTTIARLAHVAVVVAAQRNVSPDALLAPLALTPAQLADPDAHLPLSTVAHVWERAASLTGDAVFGLHAAEVMNTQRGNVFDYVAASCTTARALFSAAMRYQRLLLSRSDLRLTEHADLARFEAHGRPPSRPSHLDDFVLAQLVLRVRRRSPSGFALRAVHFEHPAPTTADAHEHYARVFQAPVHFGATHDALTFEAALLDEPLTHSDPVLAGMLLRHADAQLRDRDEAPPPHAPSHGATESLTDTLRARIAQAGLVTAPDLRQLARSLGLSERSLQRRLRDEGTSFKDVLDDVRHREALARLADPRQSVSDVAFVLGFAEVSAFSRAFRRWTSLSPAHWRRRARDVTASPSEPAASSGVTGQHTGAR